MQKAFQCATKYQLLLAAAPCAAKMQSSNKSLLSGCISRTKKATRDQIFEGFFDQFFLDFWRYLGNEKSYRRSTGVKTTGFLGLFRFSKTNQIFGFLDDWISVFFWISGHILGTKRATGDPRVSKRPDFSGPFRFPKKN